MDIVLGGVPNAGCDSEGGVVAARVSFLSGVLALVICGRWTGHLSDDALSCELVLALGASQLVVQ